MCIKAVCGPVACLTRLAGESLKERIANYEINFKLGKSDLKELELKVYNEKRDLVDKEKKSKYPWVVAQESLTKLESLLKNIRIQEKAKSRYLCV